MKNLRKSLKNMIKNKWGRILNSSSVGVKFGGGNKKAEDFNSRLD